MPADGAARLTRMAVPVVLVHGFGTSFDLTWMSNGWVDLLGDEGRQVVGVDLLGHGADPTAGSMRQVRDRLRSAVGGAASPFGP